MTLVNLWPFLLCQPQVKVFTYSMKYVNSYLMDGHKIVHRYSWFPDDVSHSLWWSPEFYSRATLRLTFLYFTEIFQQLLDGLPWNLVQTFMVRRAWIRIMWMTLPSSITIIRSQFHFVQYFEIKNPSLNVTPAVNNVLYTIRNLPPISAVWWEEVGHPISVWSHALCCSDKLHFLINSYSCWCESVSVVNMVIIYTYHTKIIGPTNLYI